MSEPPGVPTPTVKMLHARVRRRLGRAHRVAAQIFAIGENDQGAIADGGFAKSAGGERDRVGNVGPAFRDDLGVEFVDRIDRRVVVDRERSLEESAPGESDQADAIALQLVDQILGRELDPLEAIRLHVV